MPSRCDLHRVCVIPPVHMHIIVNINLSVKLSTRHEMLSMP